MKVHVGVRRKTKMLCHGIKRVRSNRLIYSLFILTASLYILYVVSYDSSPSLWLSTTSLLLDDGQQLDNNATRVILYWTSFFDHCDFYLGFGRQPFLGCPVSNCLTTDDRSRVLDAHAVVFHARDLSSYDLPRVRSSGQRYVFLLYESPQHSWLNLRNLDNFFNWTMTYRFDSDIPPRVRLVKLDKTIPGSQPGNSTKVRKKKLIAWIVSNCWTYNRRETYVAELQHHLPVDVYGACGMQNDVCSQGVSLDNCYGRIEKDYKFYLSFENSNCWDYFTEKWTNVLRYNLVPVVYGGANYSAFAPPHSYINVMDFASPRHLAEHLRRLNADDALYDQYLYWKQDYKMEVDTMPWCDLCAKLHSAGEPHKSYTDINGWWIDGGNCSDALRLPEMGRSSLSKYAAYALDGVAFRLQTLALNVKFMWQALRR